MPQASAQWRKKVYAHPVSRNVSGWCLSLVVHIWLVWKSCWYSRSGPDRPVRLSLLYRWLCVADAPGRSLRPRPAWLWLSPLSPGVEWMSTSLLAVAFASPILAMLASISRDYGVNVFLSAEAETESGLTAAAATRGRNPPPLLWVFSRSGNAAGAAGECSAFHGSSREGGIFVRVSHYSLCERCRPFLT